MGHHLKRKKCCFCWNTKYSMLVQICLVSPNYLDNKFNFPKSSFANFHYILVLSSCKQVRQSTKYILRKMHQRWMDRQINGLTNRTHFILPLLQRWSFDHGFRKFKNIMFLNYLAWLWAIWKVVWKELLQEKGIQST